jgi:2-oxoglutarate ferredoxin oxidoreductase subunit beta
MTYIVENNGVYGLNKGQFSATADVGSKSKRGVGNQDSPIDLVSMAILLGATFVARSFSGDEGQLVPLIKAALEHRGAAFIDCVSPCVAFNNHPDSTKSYDYVRAHNEAVNFLDVIEGRDEITADYLPGSVEVVPLHDGSLLKLRKLEDGYDPTNKSAAISYLQERQAAGEIVTGLLFIDQESEDLHGRLNTVTAPLNALSESELCPGRQALDELNARLR